MNILQDLKDRGLIYQSTDEEALAKRLEEGSITLYCGFDPTADSLHIGSLLPILALRRFQLAGHKPIALVGGGTGLIGDPSGKANERTLNTPEVVKGYSESLRKQLSRFVDFEGESAAQVANNYDWIAPLSVIEFLRDIGKNFGINYMLSKESVSSRLEKGISFTEFSYMILQAYDFMNLNKNWGCELQLGGSDQWGNITAGTELIRRTSEGEAKEVFGLTLPLVTKSDGTKFGKTEGGAIWLDANLTSPYQFYQFWLNTDDRDVVPFLKYFTFLSIDEINELAQQVESAPEKRDAQRTLAREVTRIVHGDAALTRAENISKALFGGGVQGLSAEEIEEGFVDVPSVTLTELEGKTLVDLVIEAGAATSKRAAREDITNGAIYLNDVRTTELELPVADMERIGGKYIVLRKGKKKYFLVKFG